MSGLCPNNRGPRPRVDLRGVNVSYWNRVSLNLLSQAGTCEMLICAAGDIHGAMDRLYHDVLEFEASLGVRFDYVLQVGDFGIWPDSSRIDKATRHHDGVGDFPAWLGQSRQAPRPTLFIKGNHEDFVWLDARRDPEVLPCLTYLRNGCTFDIRGHGADTIRVGGVGGCYGPSDYQRRSDKLQGYAKRHYAALDEPNKRIRFGSCKRTASAHDGTALAKFEKHIEAFLLPREHRQLQGWRHEKVLSALSSVTTSERP